MPRRSRRAAGARLRRPPNSSTSPCDSVVTRPSVESVQLHTISVPEIPSLPRRYCPPRSSRLAPGMLRAEALNQLALVRVFDQSFRRGGRAAAAGADVRPMTTSPCRCAHWSRCRGRWSMPGISAKPSTRSKTRSVAPPGLGQPGSAQSGALLASGHALHARRSHRRAEPATSPRIRGQPHQHSGAVPAEHAERHDAGLDRAAGPGAR